jgi:hypothetical protein
MKKLNKHIFLVLLLLSATWADAQIFLTGLNGNSVIKEYLQTNSLPTKSSTDTLALPFFEDFSYQGPYPSSKFWTDNFVFVNRSFSVNPPSAGVATFDALDQNGELYETLSQNQSEGDYLTSKSINLNKYTTKNPITISTTELFFYDSISGGFLPSDSLWYVSDTSVLNCNHDTAVFDVDMYVTYIYHTQPENIIIYANPGLYYHDSTGYVPIPYYYSFDYSPADSIYLSFYYQPQGSSANAPEAADSLILQFYTPDLGGYWRNVWKAPGTLLKDFKQVMIPIVENEYLVRDFRFRFKSYVSTGGTANPSWNNNCDYWNIDYIYINSGRTVSDTIPDDVTIADQRISFLKKYTMVPWEHFKDVPSLREDTIKFVVRNLSYLGKDVLRNINVFLYPSDLMFNPNPGSENIMALNDDTAKFPVTTNFFSSTQDDSAHFYARVVVNGGLSQNQQFFGNNDTIVQDQYFKLFYAYDDGTAENGFGIGGIGTTNALLAYRFVTARPDTLRGIYMFFNQTVSNASQKYFYLTIWNNYAGKPYDVVHQMIGEMPEYEEGMYKFHYYPLDTAQWMADTFYIGWKQTTTDLLNIGFDANNNNRTNILYNISGAWETCPYNGSLMMRPVFSSTPFLSAPVNTSDNSIMMYPNPNNGRLFIKTDNETDYMIEISDLQGRRLFSGNYLYDGIDTSPFDNGIYMVSVSFNGKRVTQKIVIQK